MKKSENPSFNFSAYPLKAINGSASQQSPYLKIILGSKAQSLSRIRVSAMANPYGEIEKPVLANKVRKAKNVEPNGKDWFNNYE